MEAQIALGEFLQAVESFEIALDGPWEPRRALHVHGPSRLPIRFSAALTTGRGDGFVPPAMFAASSLARRWTAIISRRHASLRVSQPR
jgi:hypothetical protein